MTWWFILVGVLLLLDRLTKYLALHFLSGSGPVVLIPGVLELCYVENTGAAFGILRNHQFLFVFFALLIFAVLVIWTVKNQKTGGNRLLCILTAAVGAGALGNAADRLLHHFVIDFIYVSLIDFPVFNVADIYVTVGCFFLVLLLCLQNGESGASGKGSS